MLADRKSRGQPRQGQGAEWPEPQIFHHSFAADPLAVRQALRMALARFTRHMTPDEAGTLELLLAEVLNNIVEHGYADTGAGIITLSMVRDGRGLSCSVSDDGIELPADCLDRPIAIDSLRPIPDDLPEGGFGWFLIRDLAEDLGYHRVDGRNLLAFRMALAPQSYAG